MREYSPSGVCCAARRSKDMTLRASCPGWRLSARRRTRASSPGWWFSPRRRTRASSPGWWLSLSRSGGAFGGCVAGVLHLLALSSHGCRYSSWLQQYDCREAGCGGGDTRLEMRTFPAVYCQLRKKYILVASGVKCCHPLMRGTVRMTRDFYIISCVVQNMRTTGGAQKRGMHDRKGFEVDAGVDGSCRGGVVRGDET